MTDTLLKAEGLCRYFGALRAVENVSLDLDRSQIHAVIGTNGAGKSTVINLLSGELPLTKGRIWLSDDDVTNAPQPRRALAGLGRSYQRNNVFLPLTVFENCRLAAQTHRQRPLRFWEDAEHCALSGERAAHALDRAGLTRVGHLPASALSHGQKRQLEVAMCLATQPKVLLLDEPLAGMGAEESERMLQLLRALRADHAILLVEHDMDAVFAVADRITVMVNGTVLASGAPDAVRNNPEVQNAYLGEH
ncbi:MAG: ABC transporter ATP-binding protein [Pigmentiphaga sp.]